MKKWTRIFSAIKLAIEILTQLSDAGILKDVNRVDVAARTVNSLYLAQKVKSRGGRQA